MENQDNTLKLDAEDFQKVQDIRQKSQQNLLQIGHLTLKKNQYEAEVEKLGMLIADTLVETEEIMAEEKKISLSIVEKYGDIELNVNEGTFTPKKNA
jgi:hypothetical protein